MLGLSLRISAKKIFLFRSLGHDGVRTTVVKSLIEAQNQLRVGKGHRRKLMF